MLITATCVDRRWLALPFVVATFLLQHALQRWCPPVPVLRRRGYRTAAEIDAERQALRLLRDNEGGVKAAEERASAAPDAAQA